MDDVSELNELPYGHWKRIPLIRLSPSLFQQQPDRGDRFATQFAAAVQVFNRFLKTDNSGPIQDFADIDKLEGSVIVLPLSA